MGTVLHRHASSDLEEDLENKLEEERKMNNQAKRMLKKIVFSILPRNGKDSAVATTPCLKCRGRCSCDSCLFAVFAPLFNIQPKMKEETVKMEMVNMYVQVFGGSLR